MFERLEKIIGKENLLRIKNTSVMVVGVGLLVLNIIKKKKSRRI